MVDRVGLHKNPETGGNEKTHLQFLPPLQSAWDVVDGDQLLRGGQESVQGRVHEREHPDAALQVWWVGEVYGSYCVSA